MLKQLHLHDRLQHAPRRCPRRRATTHQASTSNSGQRYTYPEWQQALRVFHRDIACHGGQSMKHLSCGANSAGNGGGIADSQPGLPLAVSRMIGVKRMVSGSEKCQTLFRHLLSRLSELTLPRRSTQPFGTQRRYLLPAFQRHWPPPSSCRRTGNDVLHQNIRRRRARRHADAGRIPTTPSRISRRGVNRASRRRFASQLGEAVRAELFGYHQHYVSLFRQANGSRMQTVMVAYSKRQFRPLTEGPTIFQHPARAQGVNHLPEVSLSTESGLGEAASATTAGRHFHFSFSTNVFRRRADQYILLAAVVPFNHSTFDSPLSGTVMPSMANTLLRTNESTSCRGGWRATFIQIDLAATSGQHRTMLLLNRSRLFALLRTACDTPWAEKINISAYPALR